MRMAPSTLRSTQKNEQIDVYMEDTRRLFLFGEINDGLAKDICAKLSYLSAKSAKPIWLFISSPGGHVESGDAVHDMISFISAPVIVIGTGWVGSAAAHIYLSAPFERRLCLPNTRFLIHQPSGGASGHAIDFEIQAKQILLVRKRIANVIAKQTGQPLVKVLTDIERDFWMSAEESLDYGLVSKIINNEGQLSSFAI
ncbi:MAG: ATP-dependent Clp protease proteolytic subunit [Oceanospirillaceae bacterium]|nr:ATP-dependent Clp protease proteolytic subunit [Oceanospirillaceae bacterium]